MSEQIIIGLASVVVLGILAQWIAWRLNLPSILFLLVFGFIAGPVTGFLNPAEFMGDMLLPVVSLSVALVLFEGGLTLRLTELKSIGGVVLRLISIGVVITWIIGTTASYYVLGINWRLSILIGAVLTVTGPTVIGPMLAHIRPKGNVGKALKWEGIVIDPVGALLALLVFEVLVVETIKSATSLILLGILKTFVFGGGIAVLLSFLLIFMLKRYWIPDFLHEAMTFMLVLLGFVISNHFQSESGLFAVTIMGIILDNQKLVTIKNIAKFKETLRVLIISSLFIVLAARLKLETFAVIHWNSLWFLLIIIFIARPLSVFISTIGSSFNLKEKIFLSWMAPRGIVAAAVASIFAFKLKNTGLEQIEFLVPVTFIVIVGTVFIYGITSPFVAKWLKVSQTDPQGVLFIGGHNWVRDIAKVIQQEGFKVALIDTSERNVIAARYKGIPAFHGNILSENIADEIDLDGIGKLLALTSNDEVNALSALNLSEYFNSEHLFQLKPQIDASTKSAGYIPKHLRGRYLFHRDIHFNSLQNLYMRGLSIQTFQITKEKTFEAIVSDLNSEALLLFIKSSGGKLRVITENTQPQPEPGDKVIILG